MYLPRFRLNKRGFLTGIAALALFFSAGIQDTASAASAQQVNARADAALARLRTSQPAAAEMLANAKGVLIFPEIVKAGLLIGGATGEGVMRIDGKVAGYYRSAAVSYGFQAGVTKFGYIMLLMDEASVDFVRDSKGWEVGVGPTVTIADEAIFAKRLSTTTEQSGIFVFFVNQKGYFAGAGIEGTKITRISK